MKLRGRLLLIAALAGAGALGACERRAENQAMVVAGGDAQRGATLIGQVGCGACHEIPGLAGAAGEVGPPLTHVARRTVIAGVLANTPDNLVHWIQQPQAVVPGNAMPDMGLRPQQARDIAAYLGTLQ
jgi:cytochrome c2